MFCNLSEPAAAGNRINFSQKLNKIHHYLYRTAGKMLQDIEPETILFLSKLKEIKIGMETGYEIHIVKDDSKLPLVEILISKNQENPVIHEFLLYTKSFEKPSNINPEKRQGINKRDVSILFTLERIFSTE